MLIRMVAMNKSIFMKLKINDSNLINEDSITLYSQYSITEPADGIITPIATAAVTNNVYGTQKYSKHRYGTTG